MNKNKLEVSKKRRVVGNVALSMIIFTVLAYSFLKIIENFYFVKSSGDQAVVLENKNIVTE